MSSTATKPTKKVVVKKTCRYVTKKVRGKKRRVKVCTTKKVVAKKTPVKTPAKAPVKAPAATTPAATPEKASSPTRLATPAAVPATATQPLPLPSATPIPAATPAPDTTPVPVFTKTASVANMERLLWRAGFGPAPGQAAAMAGMTIEQAVRSLTRPSGAAQLVGPEPHDDQGNPLAPADVWGHDHCFWLDRMVRTSQPLVERMALIWHDWFATSNDPIAQQQLLLDQIDLFRAKGLGSFDELFQAVTIDPAMLVWLNGADSSKWNVNENYGREMMELFSLGAGRDAYTEADIREAARALTGWRRSWSAELGHYNFRYDATYHDTKSKTIFGQSGNFGHADAVRLCVEHPLHASFFCSKMWSYFVPTPPSDATLASLQGIYLSSGRQIRPVVEAILQHPDFYEGDDMVIPPVVWNAGLLKSAGRGIDTTAWTWLSSLHGQRLFYPPNVSGWDDARWLDTSTIRGRWQTAQYVLKPQVINPWGAPAYDADETAATGITRAMAALNNPSLSDETQTVLAEFARSAVPADLPVWNRGVYRAMRQNALRMLIATSPDSHVC